MISRRPKKCKWCKQENPNHFQYQCMLNPKVAKRKQIPKKGKRAYEYDTWRDEVAKPYLDATFGHVCADCGKGDYVGYSDEGLLIVHTLDVDHIDERGSSPSGKMDLTNVQYLGRYPCHYNKTNHLGKYRREK